MFSVFSLKKFMCKKNSVSMLCIEVAPEDLFQECFQTGEGQEYLHPREVSKLPGYTHLSHTSSHLSQEGIVITVD